MPTLSYDHPLALATGMLEMSDGASAYGQDYVPQRDSSGTSSGKRAGTDTLSYAFGICYGCGGGDAWIKTVRTYLGEKMRLCDECYEMAREVLRLVIVPGDVSVTERCDRCWGYGNPRDFTDLRKSSGHADAYGGLCPECAGE